MDQTPIADMKFETALAELEDKKEQEASIYNQLVSRYVSKDQIVPTVHTEVFERFYIAKTLFDF